MYVDSVLHIADLDAYIYKVDLGAHILRVDIRAYIYIPAIVLLFRLGKNLFMKKFIKMFVTLFAHVEHSRGSFILVLRLGD
jgi:hypothetical protein